MKSISYLFLVVLLAFAACKKKTPDPEPEPAPPTTTGANLTVDINSPSQASFSLDGTTLSYVTDDVHYFGGSGSGGNTSRTYYTGIDDGDTITFINISKGMITTLGGPPEDSTFRSFFPVAAIPYSANATNGLEISIWDSNHVEWSTSFGTGNQTGSTFNIVQKKDEEQGYLYVKIYATFSCKVYNAAGTAKTITNGKYVGYFGNF